MGMPYDMPPLKRHPLQRWMTNLPNNIRELSILDLAIPGSHDSFAKNLDQEEPLAQNMDAKVLIDIENIIDGLIFPVREVLNLAFDGIVKKIVHNWAVTQHSTITEQLHNGIRYFDLRTMPHKEKGTLYNAHSLYGPSTQHVLRSIQHFQSNNPDELVFIDFHKFHDMSSNDYDKLARMLNTKFGSKLCQPPNDEDRPISTMTLNSLRNENCNVIALYPNEALNYPKPQNVWKNDDNVRNKWGNKQTSAAMLNVIF